LPLRDFTAIIAVAVPCGRSSVVERVLPKHDIVGSIPIARSKRPSYPVVVFVFWSLT
jgi:hypothetical protein